MRRILGGIFLLLYYQGLARGNILLKNNFVYILNKFLMNYGINYFSEFLTPRKNILY
jgi:hypothetical protein